MASSLKEFRASRTVLNELPLIVMEGGTDHDPDLLAQTCYKYEFHDGEEIVNAYIFINEASNEFEFYTFDIASDASLEEAERRLYEVVYIEHVG